ncbi:hypothetical protein JCM19037_2055 [Geomicrobium sp. JCM 19037]|uniref:PIG-L family deacetylase n=1 Tax=Geomicrobium sp. JCM 19037 TaxID=1460634 RepID=UPI00045F47B9|nr:PIG-L family deacetylase [Geomicrobium sp. JCM 19037]GAK03712.1 hypothetical protein JCM19037_2055 [Geomicrobium sp. JCM 19037]
MKKKLSFAVTVVTAAVLATSTTIPEVTHGHDQAHDPDLWKVLQPLETVVSFMNTGAHPDDERSALLSYMSLGNGVRTSSVIANRGEGGQNEIGTELGNGLGIIRSLELEEASEVLNLDLRILSEQLDDDIYDFGFSKSIDETLDEWGEERVYERLIRTIREERPDILFTSFLDVPSQHGHHRTMTVLTERAFVDAADASVFPEHADEGLLPWQPLKFYLPGTEETETLNFNIGIYDPIYEKTYPQLGEESRFLHRSQGMGRDLPIEDFFQSLNLAGSQVSEEDEEDIFTGLAFDLREYGKTLDNRSWENRLARLQTSLDEVVATYPDREGVYVEAVQSLREVRSAQHIADRQNMDTDLLERLDVKEAQLQRVVDESGEVEVTVTSSAYEVTRDGQVEVTIDIDNENPRPLVQLNADLHLPEGWQVTDQDVPRNVKANQKAKATFTVAIGEDAEFFDAYGEPAIIGDLSYRLRGNVVEHQVSTEETVAVLPKVGLELSPEATILNTQTRNDEIELEVTATNYYEGGYETSIRLEPTAGLTVEQATKNVQFKEVGEKKTLTFTVTGHESLTDAQESVRIYAGDDSTIVQPIDYDHIEQSYWLKDGQLDVEAFSLEVDETLRIGYIESGFDTVSERLKEAGLNVESIDEAMLTSGD